MGKVKESFDIEISSETSIKGLNSICICSGEEEVVSHVLIIVVEVENLENSSSIRSKERKSWKLSLLLKHSIRDYLNF